MRTNCFFYALKMWIRSGGRGWLMITRSRGLGGWLPHFAYSSDGLAATTRYEYVPLQRKTSVKGPGDFPLAFKGREVVKYFEQTPR